jgi:pimeloyl-ACP methyl ester carboxylesterase
MLDLRGTGDSAVPADPDSYRCDRMVPDVAALQDHLGLGSSDIMAHSAGANLALLFATHHQQRVSKLALITPSGRAVDLESDRAMRREIVQLRHNEPWFATAAAAFERVAAGEATEGDWDAMAPFFYGRWDATAQASAAAGEKWTNEAAGRVFFAEGAFDPDAMRVALAAFTSPVLVLAGELDLQRPPRIESGFAALFPAGKLVVQRGAGHYPWLDDAGRFVPVVNAFLDDGR